MKGSCSKSISDSRVSESKVSVSKISENASKDNTSDIESINTIVIPESEIGPDNVSFIARLARYGFYASLFLSPFCFFDGLQVATTHLKIMENISFELVMLGGSLLEQFFALFNSSRSFGLMGFTDGRDT